MNDSINSYVTFVLLVAVFITFIICGVITGDFGLIRMEGATL